MIKDNYIKERFLRGNRNFIILESPINGRKTILHAHYVWLKGNPAFEDIPHGYVIHHLDGDELNDDISNLVLMQKHHHMAYHSKQKILNPKISLKKDAIKIKRNTYYPTTKPRVYKKSENRFYLQFYERLDGESKSKNIFSWEGIPFSTKEMAEKVAEIIWSQKTIESHQAVIERQTEHNDRQV